MLTLPVLTDKVSDKKSQKVSSWLFRSTRVSIKSLAVRPSGDEERGAYALSTAVSSVTTTELIKISYRLCFQYWKPQISTCPLRNILMSRKSIRLAVPPTNIIQRRRAVAIHLKKKNDNDFMSEASIKAFDSVP